MRGFQELLSQFFLVHLPSARGYSHNTVASYRDSFVLLLRYLQRDKGVPPERVTFETLTPTMVEGFLAWVEEGNSASTRNNRLAALKSFFRYAQAQAPERADLAAGILAIRTKKHPRPDPKHMTIEAVRHLLDAARAAGARDLALLAVLYDSGARVQEVADLRVGDIRTERPATATLTGKGGKSRIIPLTPQVASLVRDHLAQSGAQAGEPLFANRDGQPLTRSGISHILAKHASQARAANPDTVPDKPTPHMFRHSKAVHLLENGVNLIYIRDFLGHTSITTTEIYARTNPEMKRKAIEASSADILGPTRYTPQQRDDLIGWLKNLA